MNAAAGLDAHIDTKNAHTKDDLILNLFIYLPELAEMTQNLLQQGDKSRVTSSVWEVTPTSMCTYSIYCIYKGFDENHSS